MIFYDVLITERIHCLSVRHTHTWATADGRTEYQKTLADKCEMQNIMFQIQSLSMLSAVAAWL